MDKVLFFVLIFSLLFAFIAFCIDALLYGVVLPAGDGAGVGGVEDWGTLG